jgi:hypothetical protein
VEEMGRQIDDADGMSAAPPNRCEMLHCDRRRSGPGTDIKPPFDARQTGVAFDRELPTDVPISCQVTAAASAHGGRTT